MPVDGWPYEVSDHGRVRRKPGAGPTGGRVLKTSLAGPRYPEDGYPYVMLWRNGKRWQVAVHRLVAAAFHGPCPDGREVNHKDGDKKNNRPGNLEYITSSENKLHAYANGLRVATPTPQPGEKNGAAKLTADHVCEIRRRYVAGGVRYKDLAEEYGVTPPTIGKIVRRERWAHLRQQSAAMV